MDLHFWENFKFTFISSRCNWNIKDGGCHKFPLFLLNTSMSKNAASEVVHTFRSVRTGGVMNIPRLIHCYCRVSFTSLFEVKDCENDYVQKKQHTRTGCLRILPFIWLFDMLLGYSLLYSELLKSVFLIPIFSQMNFIMNCCWDWKYVRLHFKIISASGGQNNAGN